MPKRKLDDVALEIADEIAEDTIPYYHTAKTVYSVAKKAKQVLEDSTGNSINSSSNGNNYPINYLRMKSRRMFPLKKRKYYKKKARTVYGRTKKIAMAQSRGPEVKRVDLLTASGAYQSLDLTLSTTEQIFGLNIPLQGTNDYQRIGNRVKGVAVLIRGFIYNAQNGGNPTAEDMARFLVVYDKFSNGTAPTWSDVLTCQDAGGTIQNTGATLFRNDKNYDRFLILRDEVKVLDALGATGAPSTTQTVSTNPAYRVIDWYIPLDGLVTEYGSSNGSQADFNSGGIFLMVRSFNSTFGNSSWKFKGNSRYLYTDD